MTSRAHPYTVYSTAKAAIHHFTRVLSVEVGGQGVRVNTVAPGPTDTEMLAPYIANPAVKQSVIDQTPLGRLGTPADMARVVLFLAGEEARWVTGQVVQASGGWNV